jgi:hypothetical protein
VEFVVDRPIVPVCVVGHGGLLLSQVVPLNMSPDWIELALALASRPQG